MSEPGASRWRRAAAPLLLASLMVNLFLVGGVVGARFASDPPPPAPPLAPTLAPTQAPVERAAPQRPTQDPGAPWARAAATPFRDVIAQLPPDERRIVVDGFAQRRQETRAARDRVIAARARARELLAAEQLNEAALSAALAEIRASSAAQQSLTHAVMLEMAPRLGADSRRKLADALKAQ